MSKPYDIHHGHAIGHGHGHGHGCSCGCVDKYNRLSPMPTPLTQHVTNLLCNDVPVGIFTEVIQVEDDADPMLRQFTLSKTPLQFFQPMVFINGILQVYGVHYTLPFGSDTLTFTETVKKSLAGDTISVVYMFENA